MTRLILVRHGATDWNHEGRYQGHSDTPLNEEGWAQARRLVGLLRDSGLAQVVSSDLRRASDTAQVLVEGLRLAPARLDPRLREIDLGDWEGRLAMEIARNDPLAWEARRRDPLNTGAPGGETTRQVAERVWNSLDELAWQKPDGMVAVVSHGLALATALCRVQGLPLDRAGELVPENAVPIGVDWPDPR